MKYRLYLLLAAGILGTAGCGTGRVVIDPTGVDMGLYHQDLAECQDIAKQVRGKAVGGAVGGAVVGGAIGGIIGDRNRAERGAGVGAVVGVARGGRATRKERQTVVKNCLRNRGYAVLN